MATIRTIDELVEKGIIHFAQKPEKNPQNLRFQKILASLIEEDYPAKTPIIENAVFRTFDLDEYSSVMFVANPKDLPIILAAFRADPKVVAGGLGVGFKDEAVLQMENKSIPAQGWLDRLDQSAQVGGAVNFFSKENGELVGYNTDGYGFARSLEEKLKELGRPYSCQKAVILGGGGTAGAIVMELARDGFSQITVLNRTVAKAEAIAQKVNQFFGEEKVRFGGRDDLEQIKREVSDTDVLINATNIGVGDTQDFSSLAQIPNLPETEAVMANQRQTQEILDALSRGALVCDIVLSQGLTKTLEMARESGFATLDGVGMVTRQGARRIFEKFREFFEKKGVSEKDLLQIMEEASK